MALTVAEIKMNVEVAGADKGKRALNQLDDAAQQLAGGVTQAGVKMSGTIDSMSDFSDMAGGLRDRLMGIATPMLNFGKTSLFAASQLNESMSAVSVAFGDAAKNVFGFTGSTAKSLGLSQQDALSAATAFGVLGKSAGLTGNQLATMSNDMVQASVDLASFNNMSVDDVLIKMRAGLTGEMEGLKALGITMTEAEVEARGLAMGFEQVNGEFTQGQKILIRQALLMEKLGDASGDFNRTQSGFASQQKILAANIEELQAKIGNMFIPVFTKLTGVGIKVIDMLSKMPKEVFLVVGAFTALITVVAGVAGALAIVTGAIGTFAPFVPKVTAALSRMPGPIIKIGQALRFLSTSTPLLLAIVAAIALLTVAYKKNFLGFGDAVRAVAGWVADGFGKIVGWIQTMVSLFKMFRSGGLDPISSGFKALGIVLENIGLQTVGEWFQRMGDGISAAWKNLSEFLKTGHMSSALFRDMPKPIEIVVRLFAALAGFFINLQKSWKKGRFLTDLPRNFRIMGREIGKAAERLTGIKGIGRATALVFETFGRGLQTIIRTIQRAVGIFQDFRSRGMNPLEAAFATLGALLPRFNGIFMALYQHVVNILNIFKVLAETVVAVVRGFSENGLRGAFDALLQQLPKLGEAFLNLVKGILTVQAEIAKALLGIFKDVDWAGIGAALWAAFTGMIAAIPWSSIPDWIVGAAEWLWDTGKDVVGGLIGGFEEKWPDIKTWLGETLKTLVLAALPLAEDVVTWLIHVGKNIMTGVYNGIATFMSDTIMPFFSDAATGFKKYLDDAIPDGGEVVEWLLDFGKKIMYGAYDGITDFWNEFIAPWFGKIKDKIAEALPDDVKDALQDIIDAVSGIGSAAEDVAGKIGGFATTIKNALKGIYDWAYGPLNTIVGVIEAIIRNAERAIGLLDKLPFVGDDGGGSKSTGGEVVPINDPNFPNKRNRDNDGPQAFLPSLGGMDKAGTILSTFATRSSEMSRTFIDKFNAMANKARDFTSRVPADLGRAADSIHRSLTTRFIDANRQVTGNVTQMTGRLMEFATQAGQAGDRAGSSFTDRLRNALFRAVGVARETAMQALNALSGLAGMAGDRGFSVGAAWSQGVANGIRSFIWAISNAARDAINEAERSARDAQDMKSPSRRAAREVGKWWPLGVAMGIDAYAGAIGDAARRAVATTGGAFNGNTSVRSGRYLGGAAGGPVVRNTFLVVSSELLGEIQDAVETMRVITDPSELQSVFGGGVA